MDGLDDIIVSEFLKRYPTPKDKFDAQAKKFDYYDMLEFAENASKVIANKKLDEVSEKANVLVTNHDGSHAVERYYADNYTDVTINKESITNLKFKNE